MTETVARGRARWPLGLLVRMGLGVALVSIAVAQTDVGDRQGDSTPNAALEPGVAEVLTRFNAADRRSIADDALGLAKGSVFDTPTPVAPEYVTGFPVGGTGEVAYEGLPPQIPHAIESLVPITQSRNACLGCHQRRDEAGVGRSGFPTAMPKSHYASDLYSSTPTGAAGRVAGERFLCTQCHVAVTNSAPLVPNTYRR